MTLIRENIDHILEPYIKAAQEIYIAADKRLFLTKSLTWVGHDKHPILHLHFSYSHKAYTGSPGVIATQILKHLIIDNLTDWGYFNQDDVFTPFRHRSRYNEIKIFLTYHSAIETLEKSAKRCHKSSQPELNIPSPTCTHQTYITSSHTNEEEQNLDGYSKGYTYHDISRGAFVCTQCGKVLYYTGAWKDFYENGIPCSGSEGVDRSVIHDVPGILRRLFCKL